MNLLVTRSLTGLAAGLVVIALALGAWFAYNLKPASGTSAPKLHRVESGASVGEITASLEEAGLIRDRLAFMIYLYSRGVAGKVQAGVYQLQPNYNARQTANILTSGDTLTKVVTILSGQRLDQIKKELHENGFSKADVEAAFKADYSHHPIIAAKPKKADLEGYLYPDSYHVDLESSAEEVVNLAISNLEDKLSPLLRSTWAERGLSLHQGLTLASIIQKEVPTSAQQRAVASVFYNRLERDMKLETDPTYQYAAIKLGLEPSIHIDSPYNTYRYKGLPPGPIGSSGQSALEAVANPANSKYLFFVTGEDGKTRFSRTQAEHQALINRHGVHN